MKFSRLLVLLLFFAASVQAQHCHSRMQSSVGNSSIGGGSQGIGGGYGGSINSGSSANTGLQYEPPRDYTLGYAKNDGPFVPSTYMDYGEALALGRQQPASCEHWAKVDMLPPLGDVARAYKTAKLRTVKAPAPGSTEQGRRAGGVQAAR